MIPDKIHKNREEAEVELDLRIKKDSKNPPNPPFPYPNRKWSCRLGNHSWYTVYAVHWREPSFRIDGTPKRDEVYEVKQRRCSRCGSHQTYEGIWDMWEESWGTAPLIKFSAEGNQNGLH